MKLVSRLGFFDIVRGQWGQLTQQQVDGLGGLLGCMESDPDLTDERHAAYMLATAKWECANKWHPIEECGKGEGHVYGNPEGLWGHVYYGRGWVQLTWLRNYEVMSKKLGVPLVEHPELALDPVVAYGIMSVGMREGLFTGKSLSDYIASDGCNYVGARRIINGLDKAQTIAGYAAIFERALKTA